MSGISDEILSLSYAPSTASLKKASNSFCKVSDPAFSKDATLEFAIFLYFALPNILKSKKLEVRIRIRKKVGHTRMKVARMLIVKWKHRYEGCDDS